MQVQLYEQAAICMHMQKCRQAQQHYVFEGNNMSGRGCRQPQKHKKRNGSRARTTRGLGSCPKILNGAIHELKMKVTKIGLKTGLYEKG
jgi:hypothetical protein